MYILKNIFLLSLSVQKASTQHSAFKVNSMSKFKQISNGLHSLTNLQV